SLLVGRSGKGADARPDLYGQRSWLRRRQCVVDLFAREPRLALVGKIEPLLGTGLEPCRKLAGVKDVGVEGATGGVELGRSETLKSLRQPFIEQGVFVRPFGSIVYLTPPFTITEENLAKLTGAVARVLA